MKIGWLEWDEVSGRDGKVWADEKLLPTIEVRSGYLDPEDPRNSDNPCFTAVMPLENGLFAHLTAELPLNRRWTMYLMMWPAMVDLVADVPDLEVDWNTGEVHPIALDQTWRCTYAEDPEDYDDIFSILRRWSTLKLMWHREVKM